MTDHDEWNQADEVTKRLSGGKFLKFEPGDSYRVVPSGIPFAFEQHWLGDSSERCPGSGCTHCAKGRPAKARIRLNVFDLKENAMKIFESGSPFYRELKFFRNKYDGKGKPAFASMIFEITRHGVGK